MRHPASALSNVVEVVCETFDLDSQSSRRSAQMRKNSQSSAVKVYHQNEGNFVGLRSPQIGSVDGRHLLSMRTSSCEAINCLM